MIRRLLPGLCAFLLVVSFAFISSGSAHAATCSGSGVNRCDGKDPYKTQCNVGAVHLGIVRNTWEDGTDNYDNQVWWSNVCASNFGFVHSSNGQYLTLVAIYRSDQHNVNCNAIDQYGYSPCTVNGNTCSKFFGCDISTPGNNSLRYLAGGGPGYLYMNPNTTTWETDLLYAPSQQVQVCQLNTYDILYCSAWH